jgi:cytochrome P450
MHRGEIAVIPVQALHYDEHYWPRAEEFDPER